MDKKVIVIVTALVVVALGLALNFIINPSIFTISPSVTSVEESLLSDQINTLSEEQLAMISTDASDFSLAAQDSIAMDSSIFMYQ